jgi:hypothetical protein
VVAQQPSKRHRETTGDEANDAYGAIMAPTTLQ